MQHSRLLENERTGLADVTCLIEKLIVSINDDEGEEG